MNKRIYIDKMWGMFIGNLNDNLFHKHYALQIDDERIYSAIQYLEDIFDRIVSLEESGF